jgi:hypothetical protein
MKREALNEVEIAGLDRNRKGTTKAQMEWACGASAGIAD